jgi:hypothetical protein
MAYEAYRQKQNGIYTNIERTGSSLGETETTRNDVNEAQGAYLIAWRHPNRITIPVEDTSLSVGALVSAITYNRHNLHTTVSDYGLTPGLVINPETDRGHDEMLDTLTNTVRSGIDAAGIRAVSESRIGFHRYITNGKSVIAPGQANDEALDIRQSILASGADHGIDLKGSWGNHMTVNRFTDESSLEAAAKIVGLLRSAPNIGVSRPTSIDVGYLSVDSEHFAFTTHARFPLDRE